MLIFFIALMFSPFAAAIAFVITYAEYAKHIVDQKRVLKRALKMAVVTFIFFLVVPPLLIRLFLSL
jgi:hypothetical protein